MEGRDGVRGNRFMSNRDLPQATLWAIQRQAHNKRDQKATRVRISLSIRV